MTCIVGMIDRTDDSVWVGGDSLGSDGYTKAVEGQPKVFRNPTFSNVIMGSTSTFRHIDLLKYSDSLFTGEDAYKEVDHTYMVTRFIPRVIALFQAGVVDRDVTDAGANFIVGVEDKLFEVQTDYSVHQPSLGFCAVGSGEDIAMGSLLTTKDMMLSVPEKITLALEAAEAYCCTVQRPFRIINTKSSKIIEIP